MKKLDRAFAVELPSRKTIAHNHKKPMNGIIAFLQPNQNSIVKTTMKQMSRIITAMRLKQIDWGQHRH